MSCFCTPVEVMLFLLLFWEVLLPVVFGPLQENNYRIAALEVSDTICIHTLRKTTSAWLRVMPLLLTTSRSVDT